MRPEVERLVLLSLAIESAAEGDDWPEMPTLLAERAGAVDAIVPPLTLTEAEALREVDAKVLATFQKQKTGVIAAMAHARDGRRAQHAYGRG